MLPDREEDLAVADLLSGAPGRPQTTPQPHTLPEAESAPDLTGELPQDQGALDAIFTRAVEGALELFKANVKIQVPEPFRKSMAETRNNHSLQATWVEEHVRRGGWAGVLNCVLPETTATAAGAQTPDFLN